MSRMYVVDAGSIIAWKHFAIKAGADETLYAIKDWFYGFVNALNPTHAVFCFDAGHARREAIDPEYKVARAAKPKDEAFIEALKRAPDLISSLGAHCLRIGGEEADDLIASVVAQRGDDFDDIVIVSSDKDLSALVSDKVLQYDPRPIEDGSYRWWNVESVTQRFGLPPWRLADFLAMAGDSSDSIPGINKIGKKFAAVAMQQTKSMSELFRKAAAGELQYLKPATQKRIAEGRAEFEHSLKLVRLFAGLPVPESAEFAIKKEDAHVAQAEG